VNKEFGQPLDLPPFKGRIQPAYNMPQFIQAISDCQDLLKNSETEILLDSRNRVGAISLPLESGKTVDTVIKEFRAGGINRLKSLLLRGKAFRAWQGGMTLVEKGIETPPPVAYLEKRKRRFLGQSYFLTERVSGAREIRYLFLELKPSDLRGLLEPLGKYLSRCHERGVLHRDLSDGNILVKEAESGEFRFYLIDTNRVRIKGRIKRLKGIKNLIRLGVPRIYQRFFLGQYLGKQRVNVFLLSWYRFSKWAYTGYVELKKKLRLRQLARKLKIQ
jgi:serine/threonine protein kinase